MGLAFTCVAASDRKKSAQKFIRANHDFTHVFVDAVAHAAGTGTCVAHPSFATCECSVGNRRSDLVIAGIPCHPFTKLRNKQGRGRSGPAEEHPDIDTIFHSFPKLLSTRRPLGFVVEETDAFLGLASSDFADKPGIRWLDVFMSLCKSAGYECNAIVCQSGDWVNWPRSRPYL